MQQGPFTQKAPHLTQRATPQDGAVNRLFTSIPIPASSRGRKPALILAHPLERLPALLPNRSAAANLNGEVSSMSGSMPPPPARQPGNNDLRRAALQAAGTLSPPRPMPPFRHPRFLVLTASLQAHSTPIASTVTERQQSPACLEMPACRCRSPGRLTLTAGSWFCAQSGRPRSMCTLQVGMLPAARNRLSCSRPCSQLARQPATWLLFTALLRRVGAWYSCFELQSAGYNGQHAAFLMCRCRQLWAGAAVPARRRLHGTLLVAARPAAQGQVRVCGTAPCADAA
jgi:hypothetical protein